MRGALRWLTGDEAGRVVRLGTGLAVAVWLLLLAYARAALGGPWGGVFLALAAATAVAAVALGPWRPGGWARMGPRRRLGAAGLALPGLLVLLALEGANGTVGAQSRVENAGADAARRAHDPGPGPWPRGG
jgi:hypothetical protein